MTNIETVTVPGKVEIREDNGKRTIVGYAALFYDGSPKTEFRMMPGLIERIMPGAFTSVLAGSGDTIAAFNHNESQILGRQSNGTLRLFQEERGLRYEIDPPDTQFAIDLMKLIARGDVPGSSFGFRTAPQGEAFRRFRGATIREITNVEAVRDVGPVSRPAYDGTTVAVRGFDESKMAHELKAMYHREVQVRLRMIELARR